MTYFVYILGSNKNSKIITYVGYTNNLKKRLNLHKTDLMDCNCEKCDCKTTCGCSCCDC